MPAKSVIPALSGTSSIPLEKIENDSIIGATAGMIDVYRDAKILFSQVRMATIKLESLKGKLQEFMGVHGILDDGVTGMWLATYQVQKKKRGDYFDFDRFCADHPDLWHKYKKGEDKQRVFLFK